MEDIEFHFIKNEIIKIGDKLIDSEDIFELCKKISKSKTKQCIDTILECIFYMPVKIGIYATILGIITKNNEKLKLDVVLKLNHNIEVFIKDKPLQCLLWFRCIISLSCCHIYDFKYCLDLFNKLYELCVELYKEKKYIKGDNILYMLLSNFFYISKNIYDENKGVLDNLLHNSFDLIEKRQECIDNIDIDNNDITTIEYIYIYINSIIHSDNFNDRLYYLKNALNKYLENNLKSVATHRFYQKEIFQEIFLKKNSELDDHVWNIESITTNILERNKLSDQNNEDNHDVNNNNEDPSGGNLKTNLISLPSIIEKCININHFVNYECVEYISSLQIDFRKKKKKAYKNMHDIWLIQEHVLDILELYKDSVEFSSKVLGIYVQLQSKLYNNILIECIVNKLLLLLINKNLGTVIIRCIKYVLRKIGTLDNESFYLFMELCLCMLTFFSYEHKLLKSKENFFKRKYNDKNKILKVQGENMQNNVEEITGGVNESEGQKNKKGKKRTRYEKQFPFNRNNKKNVVILKKNEQTLNELKMLDSKIPFCIEADVKYNSDEYSDDEYLCEDNNNDNNNNNDKDDYTFEESEIDLDENNNDNNDYMFDYETFNEELEKLDLCENLKQFTKLMYCVIKKKHCRKWCRNFYFKSCSLVYKNELENLIPRCIINYCNNFKCVIDTKHDEFHEYLIFNSMIKYTYDEINNIQDRSLLLKKNENHTKDDAIKKFNDSMNILIQGFMNFLNGKCFLNNVPLFFANLSQNIMNIISNISNNHLDGNMFNSYVFENDFLKDSISWNSYDLFILFFKSLILFDSSNVSSLKQAFKNHSIILLNYKDAQNFSSDDDKRVFEMDLINIVYSHFNNSVLLNIVISLLIENLIVDEFSVMHFIFEKLDDANLDEYYVVRLLYDGINNLIILKEANDIEKNKLRRKQTRNENEEQINELENKKNELLQKIFLLCNKSIFMLCDKMMKLKKSNNSYMSKELLKESLVFLRTYLSYIDVDQFLQLCHENNFESELLELATIFKYASLKSKNKEN
ncbi:hypothetical protein PFMALIP_06167 [Plasmodium falciparum MaliPS096_E11]|uniref:MIF4G domain-containing protein n=1 Tax=Plasmodium falciparum MaliPS096_E11 TaxID=1036727 RepID=A0A024WGF6_PLAFA|nr:hypothetical protein PFMALIP_06167 [Plasmodium falciparum MaliPS096_E11]